MASITVIEKINTVNITENVTEVIVNEKVLNVTVAPIGIQGAQGEAGYPTPLIANSVLTNDGDSVSWTDEPAYIKLNGGYF